MTTIDERVNLKKLMFLQKEYTYEIFKNSKTSVFKSERKCKEEWNAIQDYVEYKIKNPGYVTYEYSKGKRDGRLFASKSIQGLRRNVRGFLASDTNDIDIVNCHPTILENICNMHSINCSTLKDYNANRGSILEKIQDDDGVDYETAKTSVLIATNSTPKQTFKTNNDFLKNYIKEMKTIRKELLQIEEYDYLKDVARHDKGNFEGSFVNHIICKYENEILGCMRTYFTENNFEIFALMFDGLMVYPSDCKINLGFIEEYIQEVTQFNNIHLSIKEHTTDIIMPEDYNPEEQMDYLTLKKLFEKDNCKVNAHFYHGYQAYKKGEFKIKYEHLYCYTKGVKKLFVDIWFIDENIRRYDREDIFPKDSMCPRNVYNLWRPFAAKSVNLNDPFAVMMENWIKDGVDFFFNHLKVLCDHDTKIYDFVVFWLAQMFQYPENKTIELIFISQEGAGKGLFKAFLTGMIGTAPKVTVTADPQNDIFGPFNEKLLNSFLIIFEEANRAGTYGKNDLKKSLITDATVSIRQKGLGSVEINSQHRFISFTNSPNPSTKNRRRDLTILCGNDKIGNAKYFDDGFAFAKSEYVCRAIYDRLMATPVKSTIIGVDIPESSFDLFVKDIQRNPIIRFLEHFCVVHTGTFHRRATSFFEEWLSFKSEEHITWEMPIDNFMAYIQSYKYSGIIHKKNGYYEIDIDILTKELFPKNQV